MQVERKFEWDDEKEKINKKKHKLSFSTAAWVFMDENRVERYDGLHSDNEDRYITVGRISVKPHIIMVVYTERSGNRIRIISARAANKNEKEAYYHGKNTLY
ncbi:MAG: BrnT family toxin [Ruminococcus sp.]|nr:BrnT family toxin [Ruminococcus sp.]MCM1382663.1 BrnT family toxin [Muribaculaceae bacterium]MCM1478600.1 BrnT family toxin [Muribaculaceae bacterium]